MPFSKWLNILSHQAALVSLPTTGSKEMATQEWQSCLSSAIVQFGYLDFFVGSEGLTSDGKCILF
jgi:hypothetical protein